MALNDSASERSPLLDHHGEGSFTPIKPSSASSLAITIPCMALLLLISLSEQLQVIPIAQIEEGIICRNVHGYVADPTSDPRCKDTAVQSELAFLQGCEITFALIPGILTGVFYGALADKYGRKVIFSLALLGCTLTQLGNIVVCRFPEVFPLRMIWVGDLLTVVGGGPVTFMAMTFTMVNDVTKNEQKSIMFLYLSAAGVAGEILGSPLAYVLMKTGAWFSLYIGFGVLCVCVLLGLALPETRPQVDTTQVPASSQASAYTAAEESAAKPSPWAKLKRSSANARSSIQDTIQSTFLNNKVVGWLLFSTLFTTLGKYATVLILQYTTKRYGWSWSEAGLLLSVKSAASLTISIVILPAASYYLIKMLSLTPILKDLWLARMSLLLYILGAFSLGLAPNSTLLVASLLVWSFADGYSFVLRGLITQAAAGQHTGMLYSVIGLLENLGTLVAGPMLAQLFHLGMNWGGTWIGLPFMVAGVLFMVAMVILVCIRVKGEQGVEVDVGEEAEGLIHGAC